MHYCGAASLYSHSVMSLDSEKIESLDGGRVGEGGRTGPVYFGFSNGAAKLGQALRRCGNVAERASCNEAASS